EVAEIVESALSHGDHFRMSGELRELSETRAIEIGGMVRVNSGCRKESSGVRASECQSPQAARECCAGDHHLDHARRARTRDHLFAVAVVAVVGEIDAEVDQRSVRGGRCHRCCAKVWHTCAYLTEWRRSAAAS